MFEYPGLQVYVSGNLENAEADPEYLEGDKEVQLGEYRTYFSAGICVRVRGEGDKH